MARSYTTPPDFLRRSDAKARVAAIAIDMNAIDFILHGDKDNAASQKLILAPLDGHLEPKPDRHQKVKVDDDEGDYIRQIEDCCAEWRAEHVKPRWYPLSGSKGTDSMHYFTLLI